MQALNERRGQTIRLDLNFRDGAMNPFRPARVRVAGV